MFHSKDGSGYRFLADNVIELDAINPQVAARLVGALSNWKRFDESRQGLIKTELSRIQDKEGLSTNTLEIVSKSLE